MATITAAQVNELRTLTGAGLMDCKKALTEAAGDIQAAMDYLRKKGAKIAEIRAGRAASEGCVIAKTTADSKRGVVVYVSCETDFVAKNEEFRKLAEDIADLALNNNITTHEALLAADLNGTSVKDKLQEKVSAIGELIDIAVFETLEAEGLVPYNHMGNKIGVLVGLNAELNEKITAAGRDVAMQVAAMNPIALNKEGVSPATLDREMGIALEKAKASGKPENILQKIAESAVTSYVKENTLLTQPFVKDGSKTVQQFVSEAQAGLAITAFKRVALGQKKD